MTTIIGWLAAAAYWLAALLWRSLRRAGDPLRLNPPTDSNWVSRDMTGDDSLARSRRQT